uniref:Odorant receptor n=1 Tax=Eucryptorrhynchus brandti TaxID=436910 RepID=A0A8F4MZI1_EUCBR|nr:odorant receptor 25 [Eucryptorrhynchus brandti]
MEVLYRMLFNAPLDADILTIAENMTLLSVRNKLKMFIGVLTGLICACETAYFFYNVYFHYDVDYVMTFAALSFNNTHAVIIIFHNYSKYSSFKKGVDMIKSHFWTLDECLPESRKEILMDMKIVKIIMVASLALVLSTPVVYIPFQGVRYNETLFVFINYLGHAHVPKPLEYVIIYGSVLKLFPQGYFMLSYLFTLCYFINHYRYQVSMVKWVLLNSTKNLSIADDMPQLVESAECQKVIKHRLDKCIRQHVVLSRYAEYLVKHFYYTILWHIFSGISLFTSLLYIFLFHNAANNPVALIINILGAYFAAFLYTAYGQLFQEQTDILLEAAGASNWHFYNTSNRRSLIIFMLNLKRQYKIVGMGIITLNFEMFIWFSNKVVGLLSVVSLMEE